MDIPTYKTALIVGAGEGLSASLARLFAREGIRVALAARQIEKLHPAEEAVRIIESVIASHAHAEVSAHRP